MNKPLLALAFLTLALSAFGQIVPDQVLLKEYRPKSIYKIPETKVDKAKFPVIDMHTHVYAGDAAAVERWIKTMDEVGLEKSVILSGNVGAKLDEVIARFGKFPDRFEVWSGIDFSG